MTQQRIAFIGISGVGKSTFLAKFAETLAFQHLQASAVIRERRNGNFAPTIEIDSLREVDIDENQRFLVEGFEHLSDKNANCVILDGHSIIDTPSGLIKIDPVVFSTIGISHFVFLYDRPDKIFARRQADSARSRPSRTVEELSHHQNEAVLSAFNAARYSHVPMDIISHEHERRFSMLLRGSGK
jgi:adenylate kinase